MESTSRQTTGDIPRTVGKYSGIQGILRLDGAAGLQIQPSGGSRTQGFKGSRVLGRAKRQSRAQEFKVNENRSNKETNKDAI